MQSWTFKKGMENEETSTRHSIVPKGKRFIFSLSLWDNNKKIKWRCFTKNSKRTAKDKSTTFNRARTCGFLIGSFRTVSSIHQHLQSSITICEWIERTKKKRRLKAHINCLWNKRNSKSIFEHCFQLSTGRFSRILCSTVMKLKFMLQLWIFHPFQMNIESSKLKYATYSLFHDWCGTGEFASRWHFIHVSENTFARERKEMQFHGNRLN